MTRWHEKVIVVVSDVFNFKRRSCFSSRPWTLMSGRGQAKYQTRIDETRVQNSELAKSFVVLKSDGFDVVGSSGSRTSCCQRYLCPRPQHDQWQGLPHLLVLDHLHSHRWMFKNLLPHLSSQVKLTQRKNENDKVSVFRSAIVRFQMINLRMNRYFRRSSAKLQKIESYIKQCKLGDWWVQCLQFN